MAGQPDWQRFQSQAVPAIVNTSYTANFNTGGLYVGAWQSLFISGRDAGATNYWSVTVWWGDTATGPWIVWNEPINIGNGVKTVTWIPIKSRYVKLEGSLTAGGVAQSLSLVAIPLATPARQGADANTNPHLTDIENTVPPFTWNYWNLTLTRPGRAIMAYSTLFPRLIFQLWRLDPDGVFRVQHTYRCDTANRTFTHRLTLEAIPFQVRIVNTSQWATIGYSLTILPA